MGGGGRDRAQENRYGCDYSRHNDDNGINNDGLWMGIELMWLWGDEVCWVWGCGGSGIILAVVGMGSKFVTQIISHKSQLEWTSLMIIKSNASYHVGEVVCGEGFVGEGSVVLPLLWFK